MAEPRTVRSPKENAAESELTIIQDGMTRLKILVVDADANGQDRSVTLAMAGDIIKATVARLPQRTREAARQSLIAAFQRWDAFYRKARQTVNAAFMAQVQKLAKTRPQIFNENKTYTIDLNSWAKAGTGQAQSSIIERFRPYLTEDKRGAAIIADYDKRVKEQVRLLAADPAQATPVDKNGKTLSLRNLVEMEVRYEANNKDIDNLKAEGVDLVWTSSHADASPRCEPWQGRLYSLSGKSGQTASGEHYTPFDEARNANGGNSIISGYNCRHRIIEYVPGTKAPKEYDAKTIRQENYVNNKQRQFERDIRNLKVEERLARASGNDEYAHELRQTWQAKRDQYIDFSHGNNRPYYLWRTRIVEGEQ